MFSLVRRLAFRKKGRWLVSMAFVGAPVFVYLFMLSYISADTPVVKFANSFIDIGLPKGAWLAAAMIWAFILCSTLLFNVLVGTRDED